MLETKRLLAEGMEKRPLKELARLLAHRDMRVRQEAQFALANRGDSAIKALAIVARKDAHQLARLHAIWALGQITASFQGGGPLVPPAAKMAATKPTPNPSREGKWPSTSERLLPSWEGSGVGSAFDLLVHLLGDNDAEVRAQSAKILGECRFSNAYDGLIKLLSDASPRVRFFTALSLGKLGRREGLPAILSMLRENGDKDPYLRHAGVMALTWIADMDALLGAAKDISSSVRMAVVLAMRRLQRGEIAMFLNDSNPAVVLEAARAINDEPINGAMRELAALIHSPTLLSLPLTRPEATLSHRMGEGRGEGLMSEPLLRRVLNANFRLGTPESAKALASFAARGDAPENMRLEALEELSDWPYPSGRDRVVGLWRPLAAVRHRETAVEVLQPVLAEILRTAPDPVRVAAVHATRRLTITDTGPVLFELVRDTNLSGEVRVEALNTLAALDHPQFEHTLQLAQTDATEDLRKAATLLQAKVKSPYAAVTLATILDRGTLAEKQAALTALGRLHDRAADEILERWLDDLLAGKVPKELQFDLLGAAAKRPAASVKQKLSQYQAARPKDDPLSEYRETLFGGDAAEGKKIFFERPETQCVRCHKINGEGGDVGPDLSHVGEQKDRQFLLESIALPNKQITEGFESVLVTSKNGQSYAGIVKSETAGELVINSPEDGPVTVKKGDIQSRERGLSPMPEGMVQGISKQDLRNLVEFLSSLK